MVKSKRMDKNLVLIFDFDGTIADTLTFVRKIFNFPEMKEVDWEGLKNKESREVFKILGISMAELPFVLNKVRGIIHKEIEKIKPIQGMAETLFKIKESSSQLGILTSAPKETVERFLQVNNLNLFDFIYSESNIFNKARKLSNLLKERNFDPQSVFYVGDETRDVEAARKAGVKTIAVTWGFNGEDILKKQKPDYLARRPEELIALLDNF